MANPNEPLERSDIAPTYNRQLHPLTVEDFATRLSEMKKPSSSVSKDPLNRFLTGETATVFSKALTPIINYVWLKGLWPAIWKCEEGTIIPKNGCLVNFDESTLITSTSIFSKLCELYLLEQLCEEVSLPRDQFGGQPGAGTEHLLVQLIMEQMEILDDNRACTTLISINLEKAFNRMSHGICLKSWQKEEHQHKH